jgi:glycosyltransferase involved in cell wall biosynthesis
MPPNTPFVPTFTHNYMVAEQPLVTALINTYNYARYLPFAVNSILKQTYPNIEIIIVDDGSTDHTSEILTQYADRVQTIRTTNGGQGHAFNVGIARAQGELIMLLDADDMWVQEKVELMVQFAVKQPKAGMLYHRYQNVDGHGKYDGQPQPFPLINGNYRRRYLRSGGSWWSPIASVLTLRTDHIRKALPLPTYAVREGADTIIIDYCAITSEIASLPDALTLRRVHGANLYARGREDFFHRSREIRMSDIRRIEWRMFSMRHLMNRLGVPFDVDLNRNEWRMTNLYLLGNASLWQYLKACLLSFEHGLKSRLERFKWVRMGKRAAKRDEIAQRKAGSSIR